MKLATISSKNQITIPADILADLRVRPKSKLLVEKNEDVIILTPLRKSVVDELAGSLNKYIHPSKLGVPFDVIMEETRKKVAKHLTRKR